MGDGGGSRKDHEAAAVRRSSLLPAARQGDARRRSAWLTVAAAARAAALQGLPRKAYAARVYTVGRNKYGVKAGQDQVRAQHGCKAESPGAAVAHWLRALLLPAACRRFGRRRAGSTLRTRGAGSRPAAAPLLPCSPSLPVCSLVCGAVWRLPSHTHAPYCSGTAASSRAAAPTTTLARSAAGAQAPPAANLQRLPSVHFTACLHSTHRQEQPTLAPRAGKASSATRGAGCAPWSTRSSGGRRRCTSLRLPLLCSRLRQQRG